MFHAAVASLGSFHLSNSSLGWWWIFWCWFSFIICWYWFFNIFWWCILDWHVENMNANNNILLNAATTTTRNSFSYHQLDWIWKINLVDLTNWSWLGIRPESRHLIRTIYYCMKWVDTELLRNVIVFISNTSIETSIIAQFRYILRSVYTRSQMSSKIPLQTHV